MRSRTLPLLTAIGAVAASTVTLAPAASAAGTVRPSFVFTSDRDGDLEIFARRTDGSTVQVTRNRVDDLQAVWSPDGSRLAVVRQVGQGTALVVMDADGTGARRLTSPVTFADGRASSDTDPAWSPDGRTIAFTSDRASGQEPEIHRIDADGTDLRRLTRTEPFVGDFHPTWSPDGRFLYFTSDRAGVFNQEIHRMRPDGSGVQRITRTPDGVDDGVPDVAPNGARIVFSSMRANGTQDLFTMDRDGSGVRPLGTPTADRDEVFAQWTANGSQVVFMRFGTPEQPNSTIWVVDADGSDRRSLTTGRFDDSMPDPYPLARG
jgi:Tol biopolymer transport system component